MSNAWISPVIEYYKIFFGNAADIVIDVGTREGDDAYLIKQRLITKNIYAIDAREEAAKLTKEKYPDFNVFYTAISNYTGITNFCSVISEDPDYVGSSSIYNKKFRRKEYKHNVIEVPVTTMDNFIESNNLSYKFLDIVKVDIEGYTFQLLEGFTKHINNVKMFHLETEKKSTHKKHVNSESVAEYMRSKNFVLVGTQYEWGSEIEDQIWINKYLINDEKERLKWRKY
jgi:FkbM family methyltransferase